ncbi:MAG: hypothetical protein D6690_15130 [Nitrospirae bacterium]|nr:MAG: hypothetical protein D6690_15130 [Nitrospirota bacterium]
MSNPKLGLLVFWSSFWTGFPIKLAFALVFLAGGIHPWEGTGLYLLLLISIPIDIWAIGLCARTVFIERLGLEPPPGLGLALWWQWMIFNLLYLPLLYVVVSAVASGARSVAAVIIEFMKEHVVPHLPIAEQIALELVMWGSVTTLVFVLLAIGWFYGLGAIVQRQAKVAAPLRAGYEERVYLWDRLRIPSDQPLLLTSFTGVGVMLVFLFWGLIPTTTPHPHEEYQPTTAKEVERPVDPKQVIKKAEHVLAQATVTLEKLETEGQSSTEKSKASSGESKGAVKQATKAAKSKTSSRPASTVPASQGTQMPAKSDHQR